MFTRRVAPVALALTAALTLAGCSSNDAADDPTIGTRTEQAAEASPELAAVLADLDLTGLDAREVIHRLDTTTLADRRSDVRASIRPTEVLFTDSTGTEASMPLPEGEFYVSIAPYVDQTHECYFHSLTTCVGELQNEEVEVTILDAATGEVLVQGTEVTYDNGFIGFWLPAGIDAEVTITHDGRTGTETLPTRAADDRTCVTTVRLT